MPLHTHRERPCVNVPFKHTYEIPSDRLAEYCLVPSHLSPMDLGTLKERRLPHNPKIIIGDAYPDQTQGPVKSVHHISLRASSAKSAAEHP